MTERNALGGSNAHDSVQRQIEETHLALGAAEQEPPVAELLEQIRVQHILNGATLVKRLIEHVQHTTVGNVVIERAEQLEAFQIRHTVVVNNRAALLTRDR